MKTLIIGASDKPERYAYIALNMLLNHGHAVEGIARREMEVSGIQIKNGKPDFKAIHIVTLYLSASHQKDYYDYIVGLNPKRVIFNPGTENPEFYAILEKHNITYDIACTLVLLSTNQY